MPKKEKKNSLLKILGLILLGLIILGFTIKTFLHGHNVALFNPKGMIAHEQLRLMLLTAGILLAAALPVVAVLYFTAWKYRESNKKAKHEPDSRHGWLLNAVIWLIPGIIAIILSLIMWPATHRLAPQKPIAADAKPMTIQVVSMRWKWLFIYPEQKIATVNYVQLPANIPVQFELTADDAPMSSFWIPNLSGMLYTMTGHSNHLNIIADTLGDYPGRSGEINGAGFAGMQFTARVSTAADFKSWAEGVRMLDTPLDTTTYDTLLKPSENNAQASYSSVEDGLYDTILMKYMNAGGHDHTGHDNAEHGAHHE